MNTERRRVKVRAGCKMVTLQGESVAQEERPADLFGVATMQPAAVQAVSLDDGRELLIATRDLEAVP